MTPENMTPGPTVPDDWREFVELLNARGVEFVLVGGHAVGFHGYPRFTGDIDFLIRPTLENVGALVEVLAAFGFGSHPQLRDGFLEPGKIIQLGRPPHRIDLLSSLSGVDADEAFTETLPCVFGGQKVRVIGLKALLQNKRASGRAKDLADIEELERVANARSDG